MKGKTKRHRVEVDSRILVLTKVYREGDKYISRRSVTIFWDRVPFCGLLNPIIFSILKISATNEP